MARKASAKQLAQQDKFKACSREAKGLKGSERKSSMSKCLKKPKE